MLDIIKGEGRKGTLTYTITLKCEEIYIDLNLDLNQNAFNTYISISLTMELWTLNQITTSLMEDALNLDFKINSNRFG